MTCSASCGGGNQYRTVECRDGNGMTVSDSYCSATAKPVTTQSCNTQACQTVTYGWFAGSYGSCSAVCGGGNQYRPVECRTNTGNTVADSYCAHITRPTNIQSCNTQACTNYAWYTGSYGTCSASCGGGNQYRTVECRNNLGITVADAYCTGTAKPINAQSCNSHACAVATQCSGFRFCTTDNFGEWCETPECPVGCTAVLSDATDNYADIRSTNNGRSMKGKNCDAGTETLKVFCR